MNYTKMYRRIDTAPKFNSKTTKQIKITDTADTLERSLQILKISLRGRVKVSRGPFEHVKQCKFFSPICEKFFQCAGVPSPGLERGAGGGIWRLCTRNI